MLNELPQVFKDGYTFLSACERSDKSQWGEHMHMEALFCLAIGLNLARYCLPREYWGLLPGGVPYIQIKV